MRRCAMLAVAALAVHSASGTSAPYFHATEGAFDAWMGAGGQHLGEKDSFPEMRMKIARRAAQWGAEQLKDVDSIYNIKSWVARASGIDVGGLRDDLERMAKEDDVATFIKTAHEASKKMHAARSTKTVTGADDYKFWGFIPLEKGNILPNGVPVTWENKDCKKNTATGKWNADKSEIIVEIESSECGLLHVGDFYLLATTEGVHPVTINDLSKSSTTNWKLHDNSTAVLHDLETRGIRILAMPHDEVTCLENLMQTIDLFLQPNVGKYPDYPTDEAMKKNVDFLTRYTQQQPYMVERKSRAALDIDPDLIQTGDMFAILRLDGLDPMIAWAMGSANGHTTIAIRDTNNTLHVCESTVKSSYWPVDGIQCTPWATWMEWSTVAGYNMIWVPMAPEHRAKLDLTKMWDYANSNVGLEYGFTTLLWGWIDTVQNNYPCLPPDFTHCLTYNIMEVLFSVGHRFAPEVVDIIFMQAWNKRVNATGVELSPEEIFMKMDQAQIPRENIAAMVEQDSWNYTMNRYGKPTTGRSQVCCVFVCNMWKAGGLFGEHEVNCGEFGLLDDYSLSIYNPALTGDNRPEVCKQADPENELCQLVGPYTMTLKHFNKSKPIYTHMNEHCESWTPDVGPNYWPAGKQNGTC